MRPVFLLLLAILPLAIFADTTTNDDDFYEDLEEHQVHVVEQKDADETPAATENTTPETTTSTTTTTNEPTPQPISEPQAETPATTTTTTSDETEPAPAAETHTNEPVDIEDAPYVEPTPEKDPEEQPASEPAPQPDEAETTGDSSIVWSETDAPVSEQPASATPTEETTTEQPAQPAQPTQETPASTTTTTTTTTTEQPAATTTPADQTNPEPTTTTTTTTTTTEQPTPAATTTEQPASETPAATTTEQPASETPAATTTTTTTEEPATEEPEIETPASSAEEPASETPETPAAATTTTTTTTEQPASETPAATKSEEPAAETEPEAEQPAQEQPAQEQPTSTTPTTSEETPAEESPKPEPVSDEDVRVPDSATETPEEEKQIVDPYASYPNNPAHPIYGGLVLPHVRANTTFNVSTPNICGGTVRDKVHFITTQQIDTELKWYIETPYTNSTCLFRISESVDQNNHSAYINLVPSGRKDVRPDGFFPCGRTAGPESALFDIPDQIDCDACILEWIWRGPDFQVRQCADISVVAGEGISCLGQCENGGICQRGVCVCPNGYSGTYCQTAPGAFMDKTKKILMIVFFILLALILLLLLVFLCYWCARKSISQGEKDQRYHTNRQDRWIEMPEDHSGNSPAKNVRPESRDSF